MDNRLIQLCYVSSAARMMTREDLTAILQAARRHNVERGITGMLLYKDMSFLQVLEGRRADVHEVFYLISEDSRHNRINVLFESDVGYSEFGEWAMGFYQPDESEFAFMPNYSDFMQSGLVHRSLFEDQSRARGILHHFRKVG